MAHVSRRTAVPAPPPPPDIIVIELSLEEAHKLKGILGALITPARADDDPEHLYWQLRASGLYQRSPVEHEVYREMLAARAEARPPVVDL